MERFEDKREQDIPQIGFFDAIQALHPDDALIVSRNRVYHVHDLVITKTVPVHYDELNHLSSMQTLHLDDELISSEEFHEGISKLPKNNDVYPRLTVINTSSDKIPPFTLSMNVAELIQHDNVRIYSAPARVNGGGEQLTLGIGALVNEMADIVGVTANPMIIGEERAHTVEELGLESKTFLPKAQKIVLGNERVIHPRGVKAINRLQADLTALLSRSPYATTSDSDGAIEVTLRIGSQPNLDTLMLDLIDLVEEKQFRLVYTYEEIATEELGHVFSLIDDESRLVGELAGEVHLDMAVYNAYITVQDVLDSFKKGL